MTRQARYSGIDPVTGKGTTVHVSDGLIRALEACDEIDLPVLSPGLVDLQINGYNGHDLNSGEPDANSVEALSSTLCHVGVAAYLPTLITASESELCKRLSAIRQAEQSLPMSKQMIAGIHVEGPSLSAVDGPRGAHPAEHIRAPSIEEFDRWQDAAGGLVTMVTIAPETTGSVEYIRQLTRRGVCVSLGHSDATEDDIRQAVDAGARMSTHLGNGIASVLPRHPNAIWAQLGDDRLSASLIVDGHHLPQSAVRSMIRAKGVDRIVLVSDSVRFAGMKPGRYSSPIGGEVDVSADGRIAMADTPYLAGSGVSLLNIVCRFTQFTRLPFVDALKMATVNPAKLLGRSVDLVPDGQANFILFDVDDDAGTAEVRDIIFSGKSVLR